MIGSDRAVQLILELAGGTVVSPVIEVKNGEVTPRKIYAKFGKIISLLGMKISNEVMVSILKNLGFEVSELTDEGAAFTVPTWRNRDVMEQADLAEEIARIYGLDKIPDIPIKSFKQNYDDDCLKVTEYLRTQLVAAGLNEVLNNSMMDAKSALSDGIFEDSDLIRMTNPISADLSVMRPSLLPCVLNNIRYNISHKNQDLAIFEIGRVFCQNPKKYPEERIELAIAITGRIHPERYSSEKSVLYDFFDLKGMLESVSDALRISDYSFEPLNHDDPRFVKGASAILRIDKQIIGVFGLVKSSLTKGMRLSTPLYAAVIQLPGLLNADEKSQDYSPISAFPAVSRDVAFLADSSMENKRVVDFILKAGLANLESVELFDIFEGDSVGTGKKSMAYTLTFRAKDRTLTDDEVNKSYEKIRLKLEKGLGVELR